MTSTGKGTDSSFFQALWRQHPDFEKRQALEKKIQAGMANQQKFEAEGKTTGNPWVDFAQTYNHSERALIGYLEHDAHVKSFVSKLRNHLQALYGPSFNQVGTNVVNHTRVKAVMLDVYSTRYVCNWCSEALAYLVSPDSLFLQKLNAALTTKDEATQSSFHMRSFKNSQTPVNSTPYCFIRASSIKAAKGMKTRTFNTHERKEINLKPLIKSGTPVLFQYDLQQKKQYENKKLLAEVKQKPGFTSRKSEGSTTLFFTKKTQAPIDLTSPMSVENDSPLQKHFD